MGRRGYRAQPRTAAPGHPAEPSRGALSGSERGHSPPGGVPRGPGAARRRGALVFGGGFGSVRLSVPCEGERYCPVPRAPARGGGWGGDVALFHRREDGGGGGRGAGGRRRGERSGRRRGFLIPRSVKRREQIPNAKGLGLSYLIFFLVSGAALCSAIRLTHVQHPQPFKGVRRDTPKGFFFFLFLFWVEDIKEVSVVWQFC